MEEYSEQHMDEDSIHDIDRIIDYRRRVEMRIQTDTSWTKTRLNWNQNRKINRLDKDECDKRRKKYCNSQQS